MSFRSWVSVLLLSIVVCACTSPTPDSINSPPPPSSTFAPAETIAVFPTVTLDGFEGYQTTVTEVPSPDGGALARVLVALPEADQPQYFTRLEIETREGVQVIREGWSNWGMGYAIPAVLGWSSDGQYLYFADKIVPDGYVIFPIFETPMRLQAGSTLPETLGVDLHGPMALSPNGRYLATLQDEQLVVADLEQGNLLRVPIYIAEGAQAGGVAWSPDGSQLAFTILSNPFRGDRPESLIYITPAPSLAPQVALHQMDAWLRSQAWLDEQALQLTDMQGQSFILDLVSGELIEE